MTIPRLPDDVLNEILSELFFVDATAHPTSKGKGTDSRAPTAIGQSTSLLLVSRDFHALVQPFLWRSILVRCPSDFPLFFAPETGLLHLKGEAGNVRRGWVRELVLGRDAAIPFDEDNIDQQIRSYPLRSESFDLHVRLASPALHNIRRIILDESNYLGPWVDNLDHPSYQHLKHCLLPLIQLLQDENPIIDVYHDALAWLWIRIARRNDELIAELLGQFLSCSSLRELRMPFQVSAHQTDMPLFPPTTTGVTSSMVARVPTTVKEAKDLRVVLTRPAEGYKYEGLPTVKAVKELAAMLPDDARVEVEQPESLDLAPGESDEQSGSAEDDAGEWANWSWVDEKEVKTPFGPELLEVSLSSSARGRAKLTRPSCTLFPQVQDN